MANLEERLVELQKAEERLAEAWARVEAYTSQLSEAAEQLTLERNNLKLNDSEKIESKNSFPDIDERLTAGLWTGPGNLNSPISAAEEALEKRLIVLNQRGWLLEDALDKELLNSSYVDSSENIKNLQRHRTDLQKERKAVSDELTKLVEDRKRKQIKNLSKLVVAKNLKKSSEQKKLLSEREHLFLVQLREDLQKLYEE